MRRPDLLVFDVNETLSDMTAMAERFEEVGAAGHLAKPWFAGVLRDGFALTVHGEPQPLKTISVETLRDTFHGLDLDRGIDEAIEHVMGGFAGLDVHDDVADGLRDLAGLGIRLVTLSNGATTVAEQLLESAGLRDHLERLLSVEDAGTWKPAGDAYAYALDQCGVEPQQAMLVASHPWDTDGAGRAGLQSAWVNRDGRLFPAHFRAPDVEVTSLVELAERLRDLS